MRTFWVNSFSVLLLSLFGLSNTVAQISNNERQPIFLSTNSLFNLSGTVTQGNFTSDSVVVYIYREQVQGTVELVDSTFSFGIKGKYGFTNMVSGTYYLRAKQLNKSKSFIDTYYGESAVWINSKAIILRQNMTNKTINLEKESDFNGTASISGNVEYGTGDINFPIGENAKNIPVIIMQNGTIIRRTTTNSNGDFSFNNIPIMNYKLVVDYPGKSMVAHSIGLNSSNIKVDNQNFILEKSTVNFKGSTNSFNEFESGKLNVYPNPCKESLYLKNAQRVETFTIIDYTGKTKLTGNLEQLEYIDLSTLNSGVFFLLLEGVGEREVIKITKE